MVGYRAAVFPTALGLAAIVHGSPTLSAQTVRGILVDDSTRAGLVGAAVTLTDTLGKGVVTTVTNRSGRFEISAPEPGTYLLAAAAIGYRPLTVGPAFLAADSEREIELRLLPSPVPLPGLRVEVERARIEHHLKTQGFYRRRERGFGRFFTPEEIEEIDPQRYEDLLRRTPGLYFDDKGYMGSSLECANSSVSFEHSGPEVPNVYLDGVRIHFPPMGDDPEPHVDLNNLVPVSDVVGIEVFRGGATTPAEFSATGSTCTVLIWTAGG